MNGFAVWKQACQLIMRHARPMADIADIQMHKWRIAGGVIADAATLHPHTDIADTVHADIGQIEIHGFAQHML